MEDGLEVETVTMTYLKAVLTVFGLLVLYEVWYRIQRASSRPGNVHSSEFYRLRGENNELP
jgi:hypothetical protein